MEFLNFFVCSKKFFIADLHANMSQMSNSITIIFDIFGNNALQKTKWQSQVIILSNFGIGLIMLFF